MNQVECNAAVKIAGFATAGTICVVALMTDGVTAITLAMGVAAAVAGVGGYAAGVVKAAQSPKD